ncbi:hypothetical protein ACLOJK_027294 [Asimina triloba]
MEIVSERETREEFSLFYRQAASRGQWDDVPFCYRSAPDLLMRSPFVFTSLRHPFTSKIRLIMLSGTATGLLRDVFMSTLLEETRALRYDHGVYKARKGCSYFNPLRHSGPSMSLRLLSFSTPRRSSKRWPGIMSIEAAEPIGYVEFLAQRDVKCIDNPPDCVSGWEEPLPDPIPRPYLSLPTSQRWALMYFRGITIHWHSSREEVFHWCKSAHFMAGEEGERHTLKRVRPSEEEGNMADFDSSVDRASGSLSSG